MRRRTIVFMIALLMMLKAAEALGEALTVVLQNPLHEMSNTLYGLFFEDINHAADGGLYAELLLNRSFENEELLKPSVYQHLAGWQFNTSAEGNGQIEIRTEESLHQNNPTYVRITADAEGYAFQNLGYGTSAFSAGISVREGESYDLSIWLHSVSFSGKVRAALTTKGGEALSDAVFLTPGGTWGKQAGVLRAERTADNACLTFTLEGTGTLDVDMASLMPCDRIGREWPGGGLRRDLVETLRDLHPSFLRFPGGCVTEGSWVWDNLYRWKDTVGPVEERGENWNTWGYMQSYGIGFFEYFCLCEEIGALPLPVVGSGVLCQAREPYEAPMNDETLAGWIQDILDLLEFALGGPETEWGSVRHEMGHEEPFDLRYLAIGNENWGDLYFSRYAKIRAAVKEHYPEITCIVACGPVAEGGLFNASRSKILRSFPEDTADEHYYMDSSWFLRNTHRYDLYPRETKIFLGEYAAHEPAVGGRRPNNLYSALCEAAYMTGIERNSDVVTMCCYAPLMARYGMDQWTPDLIWFTGSQVVRTPNYYVQQMFAAFRGREVLDSRLTDQNDAEMKDISCGVYHVASKSREGMVCVKIVNVSGENKEIRLQLQGEALPEKMKGEITLLAGEKQDTNGLNEEKAVPVKTEILLDEGTAEWTMPGYAAAVIVLK